MSNAVSTRSRLTLAVVAAAVMIFALVPAGPASAGQVTGVVQGFAQLSGGIGTCGTGSFNGTATGLDGSAPAVLAPTTAAFNYCNPDTATGTANGSINIAGHACNFAWNRIGLVAVVNIGGACHTTGTAVAGFVPASTTNQYAVAGVGVLPL